MNNFYYRAQYYGFKTLVLKEVRRFSRIWIQTILPTPVTAFLYLMVFTAAFHNSSKEEGLLAYSIFMSPGLILMAIINNSFSNSVSSFFGAKFGKHIEELMISPLEPVLMILGFVIGAVVRGLCVGLLVFFVSQCFEPYPVNQPILAFFLALGVSLLFAQAGLFNAIFAQKFDDVSMIPTFVLTPMIYLGGVFYQVKKVDISILIILIAIL
jgi:ABC-2 type transport system permease protein